MSVDKSSSACMFLGLLQVFFYCVVLTGAWLFSFSLSLVFGVVYF